MKKILSLIVLFFISISSFAQSSYDINQTYDGKVTYSIGAGACVGTNNGMYGGISLYSSIKYNRIHFGTIATVPIACGGVEFLPNIGYNFKNDKIGIFIGPVIYAGDTYFVKNPGIVPGVMIGTQYSFSKHGSIVGYVRGMDGVKQKDGYSASTVYVEIGIGVTFDIHWLTF